MHHPDVSMTHVAGTALDYCIWNKGLLIDGLWALTMLDMLTMICIHDFVPLDTSGTCLVS